MERLSIYWIFSIQILVKLRKPTTEEHLQMDGRLGLRFCADSNGLSYLRESLTADRNITPEEVVKIDKKAVRKVNKLVDMAHKYNLHVSLNLHRAPGLLCQCWIP